MRYAFAFVLYGLATASIAMTNPASTYCVEFAKGRIEIVRTLKGEAGYCILPDGRRIEEWKLFRMEHPIPKKEEEKNSDSHH